VQKEAKIGAEQETERNVLEIVLFDSQLVTVSLIFFFLLFVGSFGHGLEDCEPPLPKTRTLEIEQF
jgi:hypothetical protein